MATTTYLEIVNEVLKELNEPVLSGFSEAVGFHAFVLDAVNKSLNDINGEEKEWPFNKVYGASIELVPGRQYYSVPTSSATVDWESFFVHGNEAFSNHEISGSSGPWTISGAGVFVSASGYNGITLTSGDAMSQSGSMLTNVRHRLIVRTLTGPVGITIGTDASANSVLSATSTITNYGQGQFYSTSFTPTDRTLNIRVESLSGSATVDVVSLRPDFVSRHLQNMDYDEWRQTRRSIDFDMNPDSYTFPYRVFPTNDERIFGVTPPPDYPYRLEYDYWRIPTDLVSGSETPTLPERFVDMAVRRTLYYCYKFRRDWDAMDREERDYTKYIKKMRIELINKPQSFWPR